MSEEEYKNYLSHLHSEECVSNPKEAFSVILNFQKFFTVDLDYASGELLIALFLDDKKGVIGFMKKVLFQKEHRDSLKECLTLLEFSISNFRVLTKYYFTLVSSVCVSLITNDVYFELKRKATDVLTCMLAEAPPPDFDVPGLIKSVKNYVNTTKNIPGSVIGALYTFLGFLAEKFPEYVEDDKSWLLKKYMNSLHHQNNVKKDASSSEIQGCFNGLSGYLLSFPLSSESDDCKKVYEYLKIYCQHASGARNVERRSALKVLEKHAKFFAKELYIHSESWQSVLNIWLNTTNKEDQRSGYYACIAFYKVIVGVLVNERPNNGYEQCERLLQKFSQNLDNQYLSYVFKSAVIGLSELSKCSKQYNIDLRPVFEKIMNLAKETTSEYNSVKYLPVYLEAISNYTSIFKTDFDYLNCLERLSVLLIEYYPKIEIPFQLSAAQSLEYSIYNLHNSCIHNLDSFLKHVIYQGLIRTCAHPVLIDIELQKEQGLHSDLISYKSYLSLWSYLLNLTSQIDNEVTFAVRKSISNKIFDTFIESLLIIISKLDLETIEKSPDFSDPEYAFEAKKPRDFQIFINAVDLFQDIMNTCDHNYLQSWVVNILNTVMALSYRKPLVSGFYKLIATVLKISDELNFFEDTKEETFHCRCTVETFIEDCLLKLEQYKGDLQISCLLVLLCAPTEIIKNLIPITVTSFKVILKMGSSYLPLVEQGIITLERWYYQLEPHLINPLLHQILPHFCFLLESRKFKGEPNFESADKSSDVLRKRGKIVQKISGLSDSKLLGLQKKVIIFLGKLDPVTSYNLLEESEIGETVMKNFFYQLPFNDIKPKMDLGDMVPRVCELALTCGDRATRIAACELLHSFTMRILGTFVQMDKELKKDLRNVFQKIVDTCLVLGSDSDILVYQIYNPLLYQMSHFYSRPDIYIKQNFEVQTFIQILMDGVTSNINSSVRDFASKILKEFVTWCSRHKSSEHSLYQELIKGILKNIFELSLNPEYNKRLGSALAFNNLYTTLREDEHVLNVFWVEIYYYFMCSFMLNNSSDDSTQIINAIKHVERPFVDLKTSPIFNNEIPIRRKPSELNGVLLKDVCLWTLKQCVHPNEAVRKLSMNLVESVAPHIKDCKSLQEFLQKHASTCLNTMQTEVVSLCEPTNSSSTDLWLKHFAVFLDFYGWLLCKNILSTNEFVSNLEYGKVISYFISNISLTELKNEDLRSKHSLQRLKAKCIVSLLKIISNLMSQGNREEVLVWCHDGFWKMLLKSIFTFHELGFDESIPLFKELRNTLFEILKSFSLINPDSLNCFFNTFMSWNQNLRAFDLALLPKLIARNNIDLIHQNFLKGLLLITESSFWETFNSKCLNLNNNVILKMVFDSCFVKRGRSVYTLNMEPLLHTYLCNILKLTHYDTNNVIECFLNREEVVEDETLKSLTKGEYFENKFKHVLFDALINNNDVVTVILSQNTSNQVNFIISLLQHLYFSQSQTQNNIKNFVQCVYEKWDTLLLKSDTMSLLSLVKNLVQVYSNESLPDNISEWVLNNLTHNNLKEKEMVFNILPSFSKFEEDLNTSKILSRALASLRRSSLISDITIVREGSPEHILLKSMFYGLIRSFETTKSLVVLNFLVKMISHCERFIGEESLQKSVQSFNINVSEEHVDKTLSFLYSTLENDLTEANDKLLIASKLLLPLLRTTQEKNVKTFYEKYFKQLHNVIVSAFTATTVGECKNEIMQKICVLLLFQVLYNVVDKNSILNIVNIATGSNTGKKFIQEIIFKCCDYKDTPKNHQPNILELYRQYRCYCFNTLTTMICSSTVNEGPYINFIFKAKENVWKYLVDNTKVYTLGIDFSEVPRRKKTLTMIRKKVSAEIQPVGSNTQSLKYMNSQSLFDSTLNEDVTKFDFTHTPVRTFTSVGTTLNSDLEIVLEMDSLNDHECMATICGLIKFMVEENITPLPSSDVSTTPCWLSAILSSLQQDATPYNTKLFLLKILHNVEAYIKHYAKCVTPVMLKSIIFLFGEKPINYFVTDLIVMMIKWSTIYIPEEDLQNDTTALLLYLIKNVDHERVDVFRHNVEIIKTIIEVWKRNLDVTQLSSIIYNLDEPMEVDLVGEASTSIRAVSSIVRIQLSSILLTNNIDAWTKGNEEIFLKRMIDYVLFDKMYHKPAAEVCGMVLKHLENDPQFDKLLNIVCQNMKTKMKNGECETSRLYCIFKHYPNISSNFVTILVNCARSSKGVFVQQSLEMLLSHITRTPRIEENYLSLTLVDFMKDMLRSGENNIQELGLKIIKEILNKIEEKKVISLVEEVVRLNKHKHASCRELVYKIVMWVLENCVTLRNLAAKLEEKSKLILLEGLSDGDANLQEKCFEFWMKNDLPITTQERLIYIFKKLYSPEVEPGFIRYCIKFLLEGISITQTMEELMFDYPLSQCDFKKHQLLNSWRVQHATIAPMFAQTLTSQLSRPEFFSTLEGDQSVDIRLKATLQSLMFQPTIQETVPQGTVTEESTFLASTNTNTVPDENFKVPSYNYLNRRFKKNTEQTRAYFAKREITKKQRAVEREKDKSKIRESNVRIYRDYRIGDFPDIQISHSQLIKPLKVLAMRDSIIGRKFLTSLFRGISKCLHTDPQKESFEEMIGVCINVILQDTKLLDPFFLGTTLQIALDLNITSNINAEHIATVTRCSGLAPVGTLLIEKKLTEEDVVCEPKRMRGVPGNEEKNWLCLAELYQSLGEFDALRGIFIEKLEVSSDAVEAVRCEAIRDWSGAASNYQNVLNNENPPQEYIQFYSQSFFSCLANLSDWNKLNTSIRHVLNNDLNHFWDEPWSVDVILPWFLKSEMMLSLNENSNKFSNTILPWTEDEKKLLILNTHHTEELSVAYCLLNELQRAKYYSGQSSLQFLNIWSNIIPLMKNFKASEMLKLQVISEIHDVVSVLSEQSYECMERKVECLTKQWEKNSPHRENNLLVWDVKLAFRRRFVDILKDKDVDLEEKLVSTELNLSKAALSQENFHLARKYLKITEKSFEEGDDLQMEWKYCFSVLKMLRAKYYVNPVERCVKYTEVVEDCIHNVDKVFHSNTASCLMLKAQSYHNISDIATILHKLNDLPLSGDILNRLSNCGMDTNDLKTTGLQYLQKAVSIVEEEIFEDSKFASQKSESYLKLAKYCQSLKQEEYNYIIFENLLKSMKLGNRQARQLFCWLLDIDLAKDNKLSELFIKETDMIPSWMFITWINQLLAHLNSCKFDLIKNIVLRVSREYPNAVVYAFRSSNENYKYTTDENGKRFKNFVQILKDILDDEQTETFVLSLRYLTMPEMILKYYIEKIIQNINVDWERVEELRKESLNLLLEQKNVRGVLFNRIEGLTKKLGNIFEKSRGDWHNELVTLRSAVVQQLDKTKHQTYNLKSYSTWLSNFHHSNHQLRLEIPGQYHGETIPLVKRHVTISSFKQDVLPIQSKCKPVRVNILGNDGKEYKFMVKFGECLSQDERIMQIFNHINHQLSYYHYTEPLHIDTYQVIPLTTSLGIIQWVDDTTPLLSIIKSSLSDDKDINNARVEHISNLTKMTEVPPSRLYTDIYARVNKDKAVQVYNASVKKFKSDLLKEGFWKMSTSPENFTYLRRNFATSQAVIYIAHWLLGIGDRHLENTLVSTRTGRALGIDFGYAFGFSTQFLTPPELIPFRLTPQIINFLQPLGTSGWIKETMIRTLQCLRDDYTVLIAMLQVFILEPSLNWEETSKKIAKGKDLEVNEALSFYPRKKVQLVEEKLEGASPVKGFCHDLKDGFSNQSDFLKQCLGVLLDDCRQTEKKMNTEEQVQCLIDLATDPHVLSKTWVGWDPWL